MTRTLRVRLTVETPLSHVNTPLDPEIDFPELIRQSEAPGVLDPNSIEVRNTATNKPVPHALTEDFAEVIALGYARYLDFEKLEAESRQRAKEAALERIRAEVTSMKEADDIGRVMGMVFREVRELGVDADTGVAIFADRLAG